MPYRKARLGYLSDKFPSAITVCLRFLYTRAYAGLELAYNQLGPSQKRSSVEMYAILLNGSTGVVLLRAAVVIAVIALADWLIIEPIPLGFLYLIPMLMVGSVVGRVPIIAAAMVCTLLAERFSDLPWHLRTGLSRDVLYFAAFLGAGLFIREVNRNRGVAIENLRAIERERDARRDAEEQLKVLIESSPVAVFTADAAGHVLMANGAAHRMLGLSEGGLSGTDIYRYLPALTNVSSPDSSEKHLRAVMQARGQRDDGESFLADICFSTYRTTAGTRLAAMVLDTSEELRAHEVAGLHQLLEGSRIAVSGLSHEIRNVCGAIAAVHQNLRRALSLMGNKDFEALGNLVLALERLASVNLRQSSSQATEVDLAVLLDELKIVVSPSLQEEEIAAQWVVEQHLPLVWADRSSLMQVFLNLISNSTRALTKKSIRTITISAESVGDQVLVRVIDSGGGVLHIEHLFRPFQAGSEATGLGLYMSRAFARSFGGDLRYIPLTDGACFVVELNRAST
jgi:two-component system sensor kinase FixL